MQQAAKVVEAAKPIASAAVETIASSDPQTIALAAGAAVLSYFLLPPVASVIAYNLRGYKGNHHHNDLAIRYGLSWITHCFLTTNYKHSGM